jgi:hypothetical protein
MNEITREEFLQNQNDLCKRKNIPFFMPYNGICFSCHNDIIPELIKRGNDGTHLVTGCPICNRSYDE